MIKFTFEVAYSKSVTHEIRLDTIVIENPEVITNKLAFQVCVMKAFDKKWRDERIESITFKSREDDGEEG